MGDDRIDRDAGVGVRSGDEHPIAAGVGDPGADDPEPVGVADAAVGDDVDAVSGKVIRIEVFENAGCNAADAMRGVVRFRCARAREQDVAQDRAFAAAASWSHANSSPDVVARDHDSRRIGGKGPSGGHAAAADADPLPLHDDAVGDAERAAQDVAAGRPIDRRPRLQSVRRPAGGR